ncbi:MAG: amidohydrolase family protein, partial [Hydrogenophaga sp.]
MTGYRASLLRFADDATPQFDADGLLVVDDTPGRTPVVLAAGDHAALAHRYPGLAVQDLRGHLIAPGFVDLHVHYPQTDVIGAPAAGLLPWLENYTFPHESRFHDAGYARGVADFFFDELLRHGVTTALTFATSHVASVNAAFEAAQSRGLRFITGKVLQDRHSPDGVRDDTEQSLIDTESLIQRWHGVDRLGYAITPRFAPTSTPAQLRGAGELAAN